MVIKQLQTAVYLQNKYKYRLDILLFNVFSVILQF